jgi:hypothetical protein
MSRATKRFARWLYRLSVSLDPTIAQGSGIRALCSEGHAESRLASLKNLADARNAMQILEVNAEIVRHNASRHHPLTW